MLSSWCQMMIFVSTESEVWIVTIFVELLQSFEAFLHLTLFFKVIETEFFTILLIFFTYV